jgi:Tol biopolymer transport system component
LVLSACSFQHGSLTGTAGSDDATTGGEDDGPRAIDARLVDAPPEVACISKWRAGPTFSDPELLYNVATTGNEADPFLTADEKTIYFVRTSDIYKGTRASLTVDFSNIAKASDLSSGQNDSKVSMTADGLTAFLNSARSGGVGGATDVWRATRTSTSQNFATPDQMYLINVNSSVDQWDPHISADGLRLYYAPTAVPDQHIVVASRAALTDNFGGAQVLTELDSGMHDNDPTLTSDERLIVFASNRNGDRNLWYALRDDPSLPFGAPIIVPQINTATDDGPHISSDGCRLYFTSDRDNDFDVWVTTLQ